VATAKAKGVKIINPNWVEVPSSFRGRLSLTGRYATLYRRCKDDSVIEVKLIAPRIDEPHDGVLIIRKKALVPVSDKELFQAKLKGL
jgi:hypothetical protein